MMHGHEKSDPAIVAAKPANKAKKSTAEASAGKVAAEPGERRAATKGNAGQQSTCRAQNRIVFPDGHVDVEDIIAERDKVSARGTFRGTYQGIPLERRIADKVMPIVLISGIAIFRILDGKIEEIGHEENFIEALRQLGIPAVFPPELALVKGLWQN